MNTDVKMIVLGMILMVPFGFLALKTKESYVRFVYMAVVIFGAILFGAGVGVFDAI